LKLDRLISIIVVLLRKERVQAKELAEMFDVSVRTILRDIDTINLSGIPIVTYQGVNGGIGIAEGYRLDRNIITENEMASIIRSLKGLTRGIPDSKNEILIEKFNSILSKHQLDKLNSKVNQLIIDISPWGENKVVRDNISLMNEAIDKHQRLQFTYKDYSGEKTVRTVEPYSLVLKGQKWYLYAWCSLRKDFRFFKIIRIKELKKLDELFEIRETSIEEYPWDGAWQSKENIVEVELIFEGFMENIIEEFFGDDIEKIGEKLYVRVALPEGNWLYGFILSFGAGVEVVSPPHLRNTITKVAQEICKKYI
jgi:predicted DNA-binding transcriptional regulator YafY